MVGLECAYMRHSPTGIAPKGITPKGHWSERNMPAYMLHEVLISPFGFTDMVRWDEEIVC
jgi:hypothetical protein